MEGVGGADSFFSFQKNKRFIGDTKAIVTRTRFQDDIKSKKIIALFFILVENARERRETCEYSDGGRSFFTVRISVALS